MTKYFPILLSAFLPYAVRFIFYSAALKLRKIDSTILNRFIIAGASYLLIAIPIPLPAAFAFAAMLIVPLIALRFTTEIEIFPDAVAIAAAVEIAAVFMNDYLLMPFIQTLR